MWPFLAIFNNFWEVLCLCVFSSIFKPFSYDIFSQKYYEISVKTCEMMFWKLNFLKFFKPKLKIYFISKLNSISILNLIMDHISQANICWDFQESILAFFLAIISKLFRNWFEDRYVMYFSVFKFGVTNTSWHCG